MANPLLDQTSPNELAACSQVIELTEKIDSVPRVVEIVARDLATLDRERRPRTWRDAPVDIKLGFGWADERGEIPALTGTLDMTLAAVCQRCLEPFGLPLQVSLKMLFLEPAKTLSGWDEFEVWELAESTIRPLDVAEEALIMALPLSAMHVPGDVECQPAIATHVESADTVRPFADLRMQMDEKNN